jgi:hypothetical protein
MDRGGHSRITALDEGRQAALEVAPLDEDVPPAALAAKPDVGPEPIDLPLAAATWVGTPEPDDVAEQQLDDRSV